MTIVLHYQEKTFILKWILSYKSPCQAGWWQECRMKTNLKKTDAEMGRMGPMRSGVFKEEKRE